MKTPPPAPPPADARRGEYTFDDAASVVLATGRREAGAPWHPYPGCTPLSARQRGEGPGEGSVRALLFAAGESRRMGRPKPLLDWHGEALVAYQVRQLREAGAVEVVVVVGHEAAAVGAVAAAAGARVVENAEYRSGRASSVRAGARALPDDTLAVVTLNVDQPRPATLIRLVIDAHFASGALITTPEQGGRRGHPVIFAGALLPELRVVSEEHEGLRAVVRGHAGQRFFAPIDDPTIHIEFNTPKEYAAALAALGVTQP